MARPSSQFLDEHVCNSVDAQQAFIQAVEKKMQDACIALPGDDLRVVEEGALEPLLAPIGAQVNVQATHRWAAALLHFQYMGCQCGRFPNAGFAEQDQARVLGYRFKWDKVWVAIQPSKVWIGEVSPISQEHDSFTRTPEAFPGIVRQLIAFPLLTNFSV